MKEMFDDYLAKHLESESHYDSYRKVIKKHNIGFVKLGEEECEACEEHNQHLIEANHLDNEGPGCEICKVRDKHLALARVSRELCRKDRDYPPEEGILLSSDMQKVVMIPKMPGYKSVRFQKRLTVYHQTFSPLGDAKGSVGVVWHSAMMQRNDEDVASAYISAIRSARYLDASSLTIWVDNCSAQNKNWTLYTVLCFFNYLVYTVLCFFNYLVYTALCFFNYRRS